MWGDILNAKRNVEDKDEYGCTVSLKKIPYYYRWLYQNLIDEDAENNKRKCLQTTIQQPNKWKYWLKNWLTGAIEVWYGKTSSHIDIEHLNNVYGERYLIDEDNQLDRKLQMPNEVLAGNTKFLKLGIMSSQSCIEKYSDERDQKGNAGEIWKLGIMSSRSCMDKDSDERDQRDNNVDTEKKISENDAETLTCDKEYDKRVKIESVDNKKSDGKYLIQKISK